MSNYDDEERNEEEEEEEEDRRSKNKKGNNNNNDKNKNKNIKQQQQKPDAKKTDNTNSKNKKKKGGDDDDDGEEESGASGSRNPSQDADDDDSSGGISRKERKKIESQKKFEAELAELQNQASNVHKTGDSPWAVNFENDTINEGSRNIVFNNVSISINGKPLFKDTTVKFNAGFRYALVAPNGRGKSSLLTLLKTRELPIQKSVNVMLVEQEQEMEGGDLTPVQAVLKSHTVLEAYEKEAEALRAKEELTDKDMKRLQYLETELDVMGAAQSESKVRRILYGLGFPFEWQDRPTSSFSGGWRKRIALASAVFIEPDMLMLDEPTNHLDLNAVIWLETYLSQQYNENARRPKVLIVVSHDAGFLDGLCSHVVHIEMYKLHYYRGNFSQFESQLELARAEADKRHTHYLKLIAEKKRNGMSNAQVDVWIKEQVRLGKMSEEFLEKRKDYTVTFPFKEPPPLRDGCVIKLEDVEFNYEGGPTLFKGVSCALWTDTRVTVVGPNGIGKSTLISLLTGEREPVSGYANINRQVRIGRYTQHFMDKIPLEKTPVEYVISLGMKDEFEARHLLGSFGLESICHHQMCASLSGGQKARVALASISTIVPHFILFDEPTNHLDLESIEALCDAINNFKGGVMVVTHDARLIEKTNMQLWLVGDLNVKPFKGDLHDYKAMIRKQFEEMERQKELEREQKQTDKKMARQLGAAAAASAGANEQQQTKEELLAAEKQKQADAAKAKADDIFAMLDTVVGAKKPAPKKKVVVVSKSSKSTTSSSASPSGEAGEGDAKGEEGDAAAAAAAAEAGEGATGEKKKVIVKKVVVKKKTDKE